MLKLLDNAHLEDSDDCYAFGRSARVLLTMFAMDGSYVPADVPGRVGMVLEYEDVCERLPAGAGDHKALLLAGEKRAHVFQEHCAALPFGGDPDAVAALAALRVDGLPTWASTYVPNPSFALYVRGLDLIRPYRAARALNDTVMLRRGEDAGAEPSLIVNVTARLYGNHDHQKRNRFRAPLVPARDMSAHQRAAAIGSLRLCGLDLMEEDQLLEQAIAAALGSRRSIEMGDCAITWDQYLKISRAGGLRSFDGCSPLHWFAILDSANDYKGAIDEIPEVLASALDSVPVRVLEVALVIYGVMMGKGDLVPEIARLLTRKLDLAADDLVTMLPFLKPYGVAR